jgi:hypothetical protein
MSTLSTTSGPSLRIVALVAASWCAGCHDDDALAKLAVDQTSRSVQGIAGIAFLSDIVFAIDPAVTATPVAQVRADTIANVVTRVESLFASLGCAPPGIVSDGAGSVDISTARCESSLGVLLEGQLHLGLDFATAPCGPDLCPTAATWTVETAAGAPAPFRFGFGRLLVDLTSPILIDDPLVVDQPIAARASDVTQIAEDSATSARFEITWQRGSCTVPTLNVILSDASAPDVYPIVVSADDLTGCPTTCFAAGDLSLSYASGFILNWTFDGTDTARVTGPKGVKFSAPLSCRP